MIEPRLIVTFPTTTAAIAFERMCKSEGLPGRLIPVPPQIKAGCGLAWLTIPKHRERLDCLAKEFELVYEDVVELDGV